MVYKFTNQDDRRCLSTLMHPGDCHNITLYYYSKHVVWLLWGEKVFIRGI